MPKTRRAGRKNQLRRLAAKIYNAPIHYANAELLGVEPVRPISDSPTSPGTPSFWEPTWYKAEEGIARETQIYFHEWPARLTEVTGKEFPNLPPLTIPESDPRKARYLQRRAEILHEFYGGATPAHYGSASAPITLE